MALKIFSQTGVGSQLQFGRGGGILSYSGGQFHVLAPDGTTVAPLIVRTNATLANEAISLSQAQSIVASEAYIQSFNATSDWVSNGGFYKVTILGTSHNKGFNPAIQVQEQTQANFFRIAHPEYIETNDINGNITIAVPLDPDLRFIGKVLVWK